MSATQLSLPAGACDCHTHVVGERALYPMVEDRQYTPAPAPHDALVEHLQRTCLQRAVIVQPSFYGSDNRCMLQSLKRLSGAGRGIAVVDEGVDDAALRQLHDAGVRGLRVNLESAGVRDGRLLERALHHWAARIAAWGWHLQVYASHQTIAQLTPMLTRLAVPVVLDHFAMVPADTAADDATLEPILDALASGNVYIKLSAPYRIAVGDVVAGAVSLARTFLTANPHRILWGSDWPHTNRDHGKSAHEVSRYRDIPSATLRDSIESWLPTAELRQQVLVTNPARLYQFT